jgi:hypothetical protein
MQLPSYWLPRPRFALNEKQRAACDHLLASMCTHADKPVTIDYALDIPKWQFLCYIADQEQVALHGSSNPSIQTFEPRQPTDVRAFGSQRAVYAAADGIWPLFFAILDRDRVPSIVNTCARIEFVPGHIVGPLYVFSVSRQVLHSQPWQAGSVYLLPRARFVPEPPVSFGSITLQSAQLAGFEPVVPCARLPVEPADFPFLSKIQGHDDRRIAEYVAAIEEGAPWPA